MASNLLGGGGDSTQTQSLSQANDPSHISEIAKAVADELMRRHNGDGQL